MSQSSLSTVSPVPAAPAAPLAYAGIDVGKDNLDLSIFINEQNGPGKPQRFRNNDAGIAALLRACRDAKVQLVVMESTGRYHFDVAGTLMNGQVPVKVVQPKQTRAFAKVIEQGAKNDQLDAQLLAQYAATIKPEAQTANPLDDRELRELARHRTYLTTNLASEKTRLQQTIGDCVRKQIEKTIGFFEKQIKKADEQLAKMIADDTELTRLAALAQSVPGIGQTTAVALAVNLPELGTLNRRQIARLAGLAPMDNDSGQHQGKRNIRDGRFAVRRALYMATLTATKHNPEIKALYDRLIAANKFFKVALVACMRKLLIIVNSMARKNMHWDGFNAAGNAKTPAIAA